WQKQQLATLLREVAAASVIACKDRACENMEVIAARLNISQAANCLAILLLSAAITADIYGTLQATIDARRCSPPFLVSIFAGGLAFIAILGDYVNLYDFNRQFYHEIP